ncbi:MAG: protein-L-isoaspartate(D-aspartate) O-methyltransferase [Terrimicrobiaceae bacterium]
MKWGSWLTLPAVLAGAMHHMFAQDADESARRQMVATQIRERGVTDVRVLSAMEKVPRQEFVPSDLRSLAYQDGPLPIGHGQTISQPYIVALMTELLGINSRSRVLEIGTGSGYQAAVLAEVAADVYTIELIEPLARKARETLTRLGYQNIHARSGDGYPGWPESAPYDAIIVTCAPENVPPKLVEQLREGGKLVVPVGPVGGVQELVLLEKIEGKIQQRSVTGVRFVPMLHGPE